MANGNTPAVYVGTYAKYNDGSLFGKWMHPGEYDSLDDFYAACKDLHKDERDPEFMFQDCENIPHKLYSEYGVSEDLFTFCKTVEGMSDETAEAYATYCDIFDDVDEDEFYSKFCGEEMSDEDYGYYLVEECGLLEGVPEDVARYFDYKKYGRDCKYDLTIQDGFMFYNC